MTRPGRTDRRPKRGQRPAKRAPGRLVISLRPEHRRQLVAGERAALGRDERDDRERLAGIDDDGSPATDDLERPEQADREGPVRRSRRNGT